MDYIGVLIISTLARIIKFLSKAFKKGSGTSLPGLIIETKFPWLLRYFNNQYDEVILISGTNGKTTTRSILTTIYQEEGCKVLTNLGGANIIRGIASSLLLDLNWLARPQSSIAILEVEEASLPILTKYIKPNKIVFTNIFRDQLDAYGEIDQTLDYFRQTLDQTNCEVIINKDDKKLLGILKSRGIQPVTFGVGTKNLPNYEKADPIKIQSSQHYQATQIKHQDFQVSFNVESDSQKHLAIKSFPLTGIFNIYNVVAAIAASNSKPSTINHALTRIKPVFGRGERISLKDTEHKLFLVKNPAGFEQVLDMITENVDGKKINLAILINDRIADGRDVSWLWDVNLEHFLFHQPVNQILTGGTRGMDMLLRLEYAGAQVKLVNHIPTLEQLVNKLINSQEEFLILSTYTAMREIRQELSNHTTLPDISESGN